MSTTATALRRCSTQTRACSTCRSINGRFIRVPEAQNEIGEGDGTGYTVNVPFSAGARAGDYAAAFDRVISPVLEAYHPELVLVSAGFDAHKNDPLAAMQLDAPAFGWMTSALVRTAEDSAKGRIALLLEGGYDLPALEESLFASLSALVEPTRFSGDLRAPGAVHEAEIDRTRSALRERWAVLE